nr:uncharacterized protein LOC123769775 [Procambarus clarkii]
MIPRHTLLLCRLVTVVVLALCTVGHITDAVQHTRGVASDESSRYGRSTNRTSKQTTSVELTNLEAPLTSIPESSVSSAAPAEVLSTLTSLHLTSDLGTSPSLLTTTVVPTNVSTRTLPNTYDDQPTSVIRGDLPINSDFEETVEDVSGLLFSPLETLFTPSEEPPGHEPTISDDSVINHNPTGYLEMDLYAPEGSVFVNDIQSELASVMELSNVTLESSQTTVSSFDLLRETPGNKPTNIEDIFADHSPSEHFEVDPLSRTSPSSVSANPSGLVTLKEFSAVTVELDQTTVFNFNEQEMPEYEPAALESPSISQSSTEGLEVGLHLHASSESVRVNPNELVSVKEFSHVSDVLSQPTVSSLDFLHKTSENERNTIENSFIDQNTEVNHEVELHSQLIFSSVRNNSRELSTLKELNHFTSSFNDTTVSSFNFIPMTPANEPISIENSFVTQSPAGGLEADFHSLARTVSIKENTSVLASVMALNDVTDSLKITVELKETTISSFSRLHEEDHTENVADTSKFASIDVHSDGLTPHTSSFQELYDSRIWFFIVLRGNCHLVKLDNTNVLASDFITSFSLLLLYSKDKIVVHSIECSGVKMTVNMTIDSSYYPNCEEDLNTLLSHRNLRIDLHNTSFYIESYETRRTLIFETKSDIEKDNFNILYLILGGVAVSIIFIIFAAIIFVIYRHLVLKKTKFNLGTLDTILSESPRSYKMEVDHTVRFSDTDTYYVKMYKSCSDLSSLDRYDQYGFIDHPTATIQSSPQASTNKKKSNRSIKQSHGGSYNLENRHRNLWLGRPTHAGDEIMTIRNVNILNPYDCNMREQEESLNPLLTNGSPNSRLETTAAHTDDNIDSSPCPPSVAPQNDVLKRMDDLISTTFSNSIPNITADPVGDTTYRTAYSNVIASLPAGNLNTITTTTGDSNFYPASYSSNTNTPSYNTAASNVTPTSKTSAENLCLTRITFLEMRVWPRRTAAQHNFPLLKDSGKPKPSQMINQDDILEV